MPPKSPTPKVKSADPPLAVIESWVPHWAGVGLSWFAAFFLVSILSDDLGLRWFNRIPRPLRYFAQVACLFPEAATAVIDYRAEGFSCEHRAFSEIDVRPYFPIERETKENRFFRALHFYREDRTTMRALEAYILVHHNQDVGETRARADDGSGLLGGVRFSSIHLPLGAPDEPAERYERKPLSSYPEASVKHFYYTPSTQRMRRCAELTGATAP
ncbi:MAG TPA: hypothetical protein VMI54_29690 [Polyangiaceae bacterium]|nr:hypothetical protein [Polyangiaceae bacterium]